MVIHRKKKDQMNRSRDENDRPKQNHSSKLYTVGLSSKFLLLSVSACCILAFSVGRTARIYFIERPHQQLLEHINTHNLDTQQIQASLPTPTLQEGKEFPRTLYSGKNFDSSASSSSSSLFIQKTFSDQHADSTWKPCSVEDGERQCLGSDSEEEPTEIDEEEEHLPAGQHLLVDIKNVDGEFLNSEQRLAEAMVAVVNDSKLTLLSYHCHTMMPMGVSCAGVLLESHVSFHTWPEEGVITLDLFTCGSSPLIPGLPNILRLFGVPRESGEDGEEMEAPEMLWAHKLRGFRNDQRNYLAMDMGQELLGVMDLDMKEEVASVQTKFQRIHVWDVINPRFSDLASYKKSITSDGSYESMNPDLFQPDRIVYLDGVMQSTRLGDEAYHEGLVHPGMFAHMEPKRVAIIGGGEGATLREVLKHNTVEKVVMIEIDELMVEFSRQYLPSWNDCSDLIGSAESCFEDSRTEMYYEDALKWFIDRFSEGTGISEEDKFDVIIMDALDPQDNVDFADALYNNFVFMKSLYNALSKDGIIVMQLGCSPDSRDPPEALSKDKNRAKIYGLMDAVQMKVVHVYEEFHSGFHDAWSHIVACKSTICDLNWYANSAQVEVLTHSRMLRTKSGKSALKHYDGATAKSYMVPHKVFEKVYCRNDPMPRECHLINDYQDKINVPLSSFEVKSSGIGENAGRGVFTKVDIKEGSMIGSEGKHHDVYISPHTFYYLTDIYENFPDEAKEIKPLYTYLFGYGFEGNSPAEWYQEYFVDSSINTFVNHGCNGTENMYGYTEYYCADKGCDKVNENTSDPDAFFVRGNGFFESLYSPVKDRHRSFFSCGFDYTTHKIKIGEEMLQNYLHYETNATMMSEVARDLREQCAGTSGTVTEYESGN